MPGVRVALRVRLGNERPLSEFGHLVSRGNRSQPPCVSLNTVAIQAATLTFPLTADLDASTDSSAPLAWQDLATRFVAGDERAVEEIHEQYGATVFGYLKQTLRDRGAAEDVFQHVMAEAWKRRAQYDSARAGLTTWLLMIARSRAIDEMRKQRPDPIDPESISGPAQDSGEDQILESWRIRQLLDDLPEEERVLLEMRFFEDRSQTEIADRTGIALGTIKARMVRGLDRLRTLLEAEGAWS